MSFSAHFMREMNMFARAKAYARNSWLTWGRLERRLQGMRFHTVDSSHLPLLERGETRMLAHGPFLELLREQGQQRARQWLNAHANAIGRTSTIDLMRLFG